MNEMRALAALGEEFDPATAEPPHALRRRVIAAIDPPARSSRFRMRPAARFALAGSGGIAASLAVAAVAIGLISTAGHRDQGDVRAAASAPAVAIRDVAYVQQRATAALANASNYVVRYKSNQAGIEDPGLGGTIWYDMKTCRYRVDSNAQGGGLFASEVRSRPTSRGATVLWVWWQAHTWDTTAVLPERPQPGTCADVPSIEDPNWIRESIASGYLRPVSQEQVDGRDTLRLQSVPKVPSATPTSETLWIDPDTYLPVRYRFEAASQAPTILDYTWLPRTPQNLAPFDLKPPAGFTHRAKPSSERRIGHGISGLSSGASTSGIRIR
jgi:hypothetical protein